VLVDDWYQALGKKYCHRKAGRKPKFTDSEVMTLMLAQEFMPYPSETQFLEFIRANYLALFPKLLDQSQFNRRARSLHRVLEELRRYWLAQAGFGMEFSTVIYTETTHSTAWSNGFELGGWVKGFPQGSPGATILWYPQCEYTIRPYYYVLTEESSFGSKTSHPVLDYVVTSDLNRLEDLTPCLLGHIYNTTSTASNDEAIGTAAGSILIYALLNDAGTENLRIISVDDPPNGSATFSERIINYDPDPGFIGEDTFNYIISDGITSSTGKVTVTVNEIQLFLPSVIR
jgi:hypothetical protein